MGIQKDTEFIGRIANLIYYNWLGVFSVRSMPAHVRQTTPTKNAAKDFGLISSRSKIIREHLRPYIMDVRSKVMQAELKKELRQALASHKNADGSSEISALKGFSFNEALKIEQCLKFPLTVRQPANTLVSIQIPAFNPVQSIMASEGTTRVDIQAITVSFSFDKLKSSCEIADVLSIPYIDGMRATETINLQISGRSGELVLVLLALNYWKGKGKITKNGYSPLEIIEVFKKG